MPKLVEDSSDEEDDGGEAGGEDDGWGLDDDAPVKPVCEGVAPVDVGDE